MKICMIAQFPPPIHGLSKAVQTLYDSIKGSELSVTKINITDNKKIMSTFKKLLFTDADVLYLTLSQSIGGNMRDLAILVLGILRRKHIIVHVHGGLLFRKLIDERMNRIQSFLNYAILKKIDFAIVLSENLRGNFDGILPEKKIRVIENGVDSEFVPKLDELKQLQVGRTQSNKVEVLFLSNLIESKGYRIILEVARIMKYDKKENGNQFHFTFAGSFFEASEKQYFKSFVADNDLSAYCTYAGVVSGKKKLALLHNASVFCLPTRYPIEGQPISILEAMANGEYIISTRYAAIPDMVPDGGGRLFDIDVSAQDIAEELRNLTWERCADAGRKNFNCIRKRFTQDEYIDRFYNLFAEVNL